MLQIAYIAYIAHQVVVWRLALVSFNEVNVHRARLVLGWVTVCPGSILGAGHLSWHVTSQLSLAIPF